MQIQRLLFFALSLCLFSCGQNPATSPTLEANAAVSPNAQFSQLSGMLDIPETVTPAQAVVFRSEDDGQNWQDVSAGLPGDRNLKTVTANGSSIFLGYPTKLYHAPLATARWEREAMILDDKEITHIVSGNGGLYICAYESGFYKKIIGADLLLPLNASMPDKRVFTAMETPDGTLLAGCENTIFKSSDGGKNWKQVYRGEMAFDFMAADGALFASGVQGILRSTDGGEHWEQVLHEDGVVIQSRYFEGRMVAIFGKKNSGWKSMTDDGQKNDVRTSTDGGKSWQDMSALLPHTSGIVYDYVQQGKTLFCSHEKGVFRSGDEGKTWSLVLPLNDEDFSYELVVTNGVMFAVKKFVGGC